MLTYIESKRKAKWNYWYDNEFMGYNEHL